MKEVNNNVNVYQPYSFEVSTIPYLESQPVTLESWGGNFYPIFNFDSDESKIKNVENIKLLILYIIDFIKKWSLKIIGNQIYSV